MTKHRLERPAESAGELYRRADISPEDFFQALGRVRRSARDEIERLIEWLDSTIDVDEDSAADDDPCDGDPDAEPSLGSFDRMSDQIKAWQARGGFVGDTDCEVDRSDHEPALAAPERHPNPPYAAISYSGSVVCYGPAGQYRDSSGSQHAWSSGNTDDREGCEHDGREPDVDDEDGVDKEPSFGWCDEEAARGRYPSLMGAEHEGDL
jgi:hypothetical protein